MQSSQLPSMAEIQQKFDVFFQSYRVLGSLLNNLPLSPYIKEKISHSFDTGFLWSKESLVMVQAELERASKIANEVPKQEPTEENTTEQQCAS